MNEITSENAKDEAQQTLNDRLIYPYPENVEGVSPSAFGEHENAVEIEDYYRELVTALVARIEADADSYPADIVKVVADNIVLKAQRDAAVAILRPKLSLYWGPYAVADFVLETLTALGADTKEPV